MTGLIKTSHLAAGSLGNIGGFGALAVAFCSVSAVLYMLLSGGTV